MYRALIALSVLVLVACAASEEVTYASGPKVGRAGAAGSNGIENNAGAAGADQQDPKNTGSSGIQGAAGTNGSAGAAGSAGSAGSDGGGPKPCVHDSDCAVPNLCAGNNGQECRGGYCVATLKPHACNDGVSCTTDICDVNTNGCVHTSNDAACADKQFCDATRGCLEKLPCSDPGGDAVCDRLNPGLTACEGLWKCDLVKSYCVRDPAPCGERPNAAVACSVTDANATCAWTCNPEHVDVNGDLNAAGTSNGCECQVTDAADRPTLEMVDKNCDGIVGNKAKAIFVANTGDDGNPGTMEAPKRTIRAGIDAARTSGKDVYVASGTYPEEVTMVSGVNLFGGYDAEKGWSRSKDNETRIDSPTQVGVKAVGIFEATEIQLFNVMSASATEKGGSSYAMQVISASKQVTIRGCKLSPGAGARGRDGTDGAKGKNGEKGGDGKGEQGGDGGPSTCGARGGNGADGPPDQNPKAWEAWAGLPGEPGEPAGLGGEPGEGGTRGVCKVFGSDAAGAAPDNAKKGTIPGGPGGHADPVEKFGWFDATTGQYMTPVPTRGRTGKSGAGGGGGGSGGGGRCHRGNDCRYHFGGGGGGGGSGGCGGEGGLSGSAGGGSFALVSIRSLVLVEDTGLFPSIGGDGGNGGSGGPGGDAGKRGLGAAGQDDDSGGPCGGDGAPGAEGTMGGQGGGGAGASGGPSIGIVYVGSKPAAVRVDVRLGSPGARGTGGSNGDSRAPNGELGLLAESYPASAE